MDKIFGLDSPLTKFLTKAANLMILNVLTLVCCVPVFTAGAAITAMHYVLLRMARDEDGYIVKSYFKAFKDNFKQATAVWVFYLVLFAFFIVDIMLIRQNPDVLPHFMIYILSAAAIVLFMTMQWIFPLIMRFENPVSVNVKNAILLMVAQLPRTLLMTVIWAAPAAVFAFFVYAFPVLLMFGISLPAYVCALMYSPVFKKFEPEDREEGGAEDVSSEEEKEKAYLELRRQMEEDKESAWDEDRTGQNP